MKQLLLLLATIPVLVALSNVPTTEENNSRTVYIHEVCKYDTDVVLHSIEFDEDKTTIVFLFRQTGILVDSSFVFMNTRDTVESYILQDLGTGTRYRNYQSNVGLTWDEPTFVFLGEIQEIRLDFPPVPKTMKKFSLYEKMPGGQWEFFSINLADYVNNTKEHPIYAKNEAYSYFLEKDTKMAYKTIKKYIKENPQDADALNIAGTIYFKNKDYKKANQCFEKALLINPKNANYHENLCKLLFESNEVELALQQLDSAIKYCPTQPTFYMIRAHWYTEAQEYVKAIDDYTLLIGLHRYTKKRSLMYYCRAMAYFMKDNPEECCQDLRDAFKYCEDEIDKKNLISIQNEICGTKIKRT